MGAIAATLPPEPHSQLTVLQLTSSLVSYFEKIVSIHYFPESSQSQAGNS